MKPNRITSDGTKADSTTKVEYTSVSQTIAKSNVGGSGFCQPSINYQIIKDKNKLIDFIDWLPNLEPNETYYLCLFARSKYCKDELGNNLFPHINSDREQMARFLCKKEDLFDKIKQLECEVGSYKRKGESVPQDSLALYITANPRSYKKATKTTIVKLLDIVMGTKPIHLMSAEERVKPLHLTDYFIDLGMSKKEVVKIVEVGNGAIFKKCRDMNKEIISL